MRKASAFNNAGLIRLEDEDADENEREGYRCCVTHCVA